MRSSVTRLSRILSLLLLAITIAGTGAAQAQSSLTLSRHSDFSSSDRLFEAEDTLFVRATVEGLDVTAIEESKLEVEPAGDGESVEVSLTNHLDGTFTAQIVLAELTGRTRAWKVKVEIEDNADNEFEAEGRIVIRGMADQPDRLVLRGTVESSSASEIVVAGETITITSETRIVAGGGAEVSAEELEGRRVVVTAMRNSEGNLVALQIIVPEARSVAGELELSGRIGLVGAGSITVRGIKIGVDATTEIESESGASLSLADLLPGTRVEVRAVQVAGAWLASRIRVTERDREDEENEVKGPIQELGDDYLIVADVRLEVTDTTEFEDVSGLAELEVGDIVEVEFVVLENGTAVAVKIEREEDDDDGDDDEEEIEVEGLITAVGETTIEVDGVVFQVTDSTRIESRSGTTLTLADLTTGMEVEVEGVRGADDLLIALKIKVEGETAMTVNVRGEITEKGETTLTIGTTTFTVNESTVIRAERGETVTFEQIEVGMHAHAKLMEQADGLFVAERIRVEHRFGERDVKVTGRIEAVSSTEITVGRHTFTIDAATTVEDRAGNEISVGSLQAGQVVRVEGRQEADGTLVATEIRVRNRMHSEGTIRGSVSELFEEGFAVDGVEFRVSEHTIFRNGSFADLAVGTDVNVRYRLQADDTRLALRVVLTEDDDDEVEFTGTIESIDADTLIVDGVSIVLTSETEIVLESGEAGAAADLEEGQTVEVKARDEAGTLVAVRVKVEESVVVSGSVSSAANGAVELAGRQIAITDKTLIVGRYNLELTIEAIKAGAYVEIVASNRSSASAGKTQGEVLVADRVTVLAMGTTTAVDPVADVPASFTLNQNYPNPFNPSTTITFDVLRADVGSVSLVIYNALGQEVRTLVSGALTPGTYQVSWDGRDSAGNLSASGIYLYRLRADGQVQTKSMMLIK